MKFKSGRVVLLITVLMGLTHIGTAQSSHVLNATLQIDLNRDCRLDTLFVRSGPRGVTSGLHAIGWGRRPSQDTCSHEMPERSTTLLAWPGLERASFAFLRQDIDGDSHTDLVITVRFPVRHVGSLFEGDTSIHVVLYSRLNSDTTQVVRLDRQDSAENASTWYSTVNSNQLYRPRFVSRSGIKVCDVKPSQHSSTAAEIVLRPMVQPPDAEVRAYPNPSIGESVTIDAIVTTGRYRIDVVDAVGRIVISDGNLTATGQTRLVHELKTTLHSGVYYVLVVSEDSGHVVDSDILTVLK